MKDSTKKNIPLEDAAKNGNVFDFETDKWFNKEYVIEQSKNQSPKFNIKNLDKR